MNSLYFCLVCFIWISTLNLHSHVVVVLVVVVCIFCSLIFSFLVHSSQCKTITINDSMTKHIQFIWNRTLIVVFYFFVQHSLDRDRDREQYVSFYVGYFVKHELHKLNTLCAVKKRGIQRQRFMYAEEKMYFLVEVSLFMK